MFTFSIFLFCTGKKLHEIQCSCCEPCRSSKPVPASFKSSIFTRPCQPGAALFLFVYLGLGALFCRSFFCPLHHPHKMFQMVQVAPTDLQGGGGGVHVQEECWEGCSPYYKGLKRHFFFFSKLLKWKYTSYSKPPHWLSNETFFIQWSSVVEQNYDERLPWTILSLNWGARVLNKL